MEAADANIVRKASATVEDSRRTLEKLHVLQRLDVLDANIFSGKLLKIKVHRIVGDVFLERLSSFQSL